MGKPYNMPLQRLLKKYSAVQHGSSLKTTSQILYLQDVELPLSTGDHVQMSPLVLARHPKYDNRQGILIGRGSPSSWRVKFDGYKTVQSIHESYLEPITPESRDSGIHLQKENQREQEK